MGYGSGRYDILNVVTFKAVSALAMANLNLTFLICNLGRITLFLLGLKTCPGNKGVSLSPIKALTRSSEDTL